MLLLSAPQARPKIYDELGMVACWFYRPLGSLHHTSLHHGPDCEAEGEIYLVGCQKVYIREDLCIVDTQSFVTQLLHPWRQVGLLTIRHHCKGSTGHRTRQERCKEQRLLGQEYERKIAACWQP